MLISVKVIRESASENNVIPHGVLFKTIATTGVMARLNPNDNAILGIPRRLAVLGNKTTLSAYPGRNKQRSKPAPARKRVSLI
jgi:hypothetical protein